MRKLIEIIKENEGLKLTPYRDTKGLLTIGYGHNLDDKPISKSAAEFILNDDISDAAQDLFNHYPDYAALSEPRQCALIDMTFNMGINKVKTFYKMHQAIKEYDFKRAAFEILDSKYHLDVGNRAKTNAVMMRDG